MNYAIDYYPFSLKGESALIAGGGSSIGLAIARYMLSAGSRVVIVGRRKALLQEDVKELSEGNAHVVHDVTQLEQAGKLVCRLMVKASIGF